MAVVTIVSHVVRAERWRMLLATTSHPVKLSNSFYSLMVGYLVNLVVPRGGEVSRCYNLYKLENAPVDKSFGTVVIERIVDVVCLLSLLFLSFLAESSKLIAFVNTLPLSLPGSSKIISIVLIFTSFVVLVFIAFTVLRRNQKIKTWFNKTWLGFREGFMAIFKLKQKGLFIFYSVLIWSLYFLMSYTVIRAFPATSTLGFNAVLSLFSIGAIAMAAPLPGGTGSYHFIVPQGLVFLYHIPLADAIAFTFIFHGWQTLIVIVGGAFSLLATSLLVRSKNKNLKTSDH